MSTAAAIIAAVAARGSNPHDLRDAAHEACHGIELALPEWDRESVHYALMDVRPGDRVAMECRARAVEQIVCARLGVATAPIETWAFLTSMEALKNRMDVPIDVIVEGTRKRLDCPQTLALAERILALEF